jgi:hypothetical protein
MTFYRLLADLVVVLHAAYAATVVLGMAAILVGILFRWRWIRNFWFRVIHFLMILVVAVQAVAGLDCPLTTLEKHLREKAGDAAYPGAFIGTWVNRLLFYEFQPWVFTVAYCLFGALVLATLLLAPPRCPWWNKTAS